jgi:hypothetical protein
LALLIAAPLAGQQQATVLTPDVEVTLPPMQITNEITVMTDSTQLANLNANLEALRIEIAAMECNTCGGTPTVIQAANVALVAAAFFIGWQLKGIKEKPNGDTQVDVDVDVDATHEHPKKEKKSGHD